jgi:hypothetical protein
MTVFELLQVGGFLIMLVGAYWKVKMDMKELHSAAVLEIQSLKDKAASREMLDSLKSELYQIRSDVYTRSQHDSWRQQHLQESTETTQAILEQLAAIDHKLVRVMVTMRIKEDE